MNDKNDDISLKCINNMTDMVDKILKADKDTRTLIESDDRLRFESEEKIKIIKTQKRQEYLEKARINIKVIEQIEKIKVMEKIKKIDEEFYEKIKTIEENYEKNKENWIWDIISKII